MRMQNKVAIVTGAASGIGKEIAVRFAREGGKVCVADLKLDAAMAAAVEIKQGGGDAIAVAMDVTDEKQVNSGVEETLRHYGGIDVLVSNAGVQHIAALLDLAYEDWRKVIAIHLDGAFLTTKACLRHMVESGKGGSVIYMGSVHSKEASPLKAPYVSAKHALLGLAQTLAAEGAKHNVRSNVICPSYVKTPLVEKQIPEQARELHMSEEDVVKKVMLQHTVDQEFTSVEDIAELAVFLATFPTKALTGQSVNISHGWRMD
jgi:3-hydroxybutyrate dehydrogenase